MAKIRSSTVRLNLDLSKLRRHIKSFHHELLVTWQANVLTRLVEVIYLRQGWKLPGGFDVGEQGDLDREGLSRIYSIAAKRVGRGIMKARFCLGGRYYLALQKYSEIVEFRTSDPFETECTFAQWLVSEKEMKPDMYEFWAGLFPLCYGNTVEESSGF
ncbi:hypothetical protein ASPWEDRAFT_44574 [Aspergillus wentii DTO 134E9]|uniref:Uncharacterized protein n=1 Tax=Aspergillus wentii DTO 134E9 TaxID=1073089 RepID=A0A1L9RBZ8_ASPWE|nr:uncharacterized protein ASPWEDRAFT_44574 [Aspergillus wentii DTO 134E9]OJJ32446.1 hypothetical protein ASPWEDRAFT_44574 [Aspergillus wentii DTO 134E9]